jgi:pseudaminic acid synthase
MRDGRAFIVAELSANHGHSIDIAIETIRAAKESGADAIKVQTYTPDTITLNCNNEHFQIKQGTLWDGTTLYKLYQEAYMPWEWHGQLRDEAERIGLVFFSTPFDHSAVDFLEEMRNPIYKIASFEINDIPLIEYAASKGKPMVMSTGVATIEDIEAAVAACRRVGNDQITLLKCTSSYPAPIDEANLFMIPDMARRFGVRTGLSDHTIGFLAPVVAVSLGATVIEKHFILDRSVGGPDASFSMTPDEFREMTAAVRTAESALGKIDYSLSPASLKSSHFKRSLFVTCDAHKGDMITHQNVRSVRPALGLAPSLLAGILGKKLKCDVKKGTPLSLQMID